MGAQDQIRQQAGREVWRNYPLRLRCKILAYNPMAEPTPTCVVVTYPSLQTIDQHNSFQDWMRDNSFELPVNFPGHMVFHVDPETYDAFVDPPIEYARECFPVPTTEVRARQSRVPDGWTEEEVIDRNIDPNSIQMRIVRSRQRIESYRACSAAESPMVARQYEIWNGQIRQKLDQQMVDIWSAPHRYLARFHHQAATFVSEQLKLPFCDGVQVVWRDRIEHPFQRIFGSSAVINYPRFLHTLGIDPGYIIGAYENIRAFFKSLDYDDGSVRVEKFKTYEVIDYRNEVPEV
jgi:hypothetical protein